MAAPSTNEYALPRRLGVALVLVQLAFAMLAFGYAYQRFRTFHNETFDLAFYARMAWGYGHADLWDPIVGAPFWGLHLSFILMPIGLLGRLFGQVPTLLALQSLAAAFAAWPLAKMGYRRLGARGAWLAALAIDLHPNTFHVLTFEAHPGTLALFPLAMALEAADRRAMRAFALWSGVTLICREDLALVVIGMALFAARRSLSAEARRWLLRTSVGSFAWLALFLLWVHPTFKPAVGSAEAHFGAWGGSLTSALAFLLTHPAALLEHLMEPARVSLWPRLLGPLALLPLLAPRTWWPIAPTLAMVLLSHFPTVPDDDSHYLTPALPFLVAGTIIGLARVEDWLGDARGQRWAIAAPILSLAIGQLWLGGLPGARAHDAAAFRATPDQAAIEALVATVPDDARVQSPEPLLAHFAERPFLHRGLPPERNDHALILDLRHRVRMRHQEHLLRASEEPIARAFLARDDHHPVAFGGPWALLIREPADHATRVAPYLAEALAREETRLTSCLGVVGLSRASAETVSITLRAHGPCPSDLALHLGPDPRPMRTDLLWNGELSPVFLEDGDVLRSVHSLPGIEGAPGLWLGLLRQSGARPAHEDPRWAFVPFSD